MQRSINYGENLETISGDLSNGSSGIGLTFGTIFTIHNAPADTNYIYTGTDDANVWRSKDYGETWQLITEGLPYRYCMSIETDPDVAETVYVTFSGFRWADSAGHVYKSIDAGDTWTNISGDLSDIPVNDILIDKNEETSTLYIATDVGVYVSYNDGENWSLVGSEMPVVSVYEIYFDKATSTLFAGTYGRGIFKIFMPQEPPVIINEETDDITAQTFPNPFNEHITINFNDIINGHVLLYDTEGRKIYEKIFSSSGIIIPAHNLSQGNYFVAIHAGEKILIKKVVKM
jgi:hypothetical protein